MAKVEKIERLALRLFNALQQVQSRLPREIQETITRDSGGMSIAWTFCLTLASYALKDELGVPSALESIGVWKFVSSLSSVMLLVPAELKGAMATAQQGDDSSNTAEDVAKQLKAAFDGLAGVQQSALIGWLKGAEFKAAASGFSREYPEPGPSAPSTEDPPPKPRSNRARNFDRVDLPTKRRAAAISGPTIYVREEEAEVPAPSLSNQDITRATLHSQGWTLADVDRILAGPNGRHGEHYKWRQLLRSYSSLKRLERMRFQKIVDEMERGYGKEEWERVNIGDVGDLREVEPLDIRTGVELFNAYKSFSVVERMKVAKWIRDNEKGFTAEDMNNTDLGKIPRSEVEV